jgi:hypothetical protein
VSLNDGRIPNPSNPFGIVPLSNFVQRGFGFVHDSIAILYHEVPNLSITIRNFCIAVGGSDASGEVAAAAAALKAAVQVRRGRGRSPLTGD